MAHILEKEGQYKGYTYYVAGMDIGHRCGYVSIPKGHSLFKVEYHDIDVDVHGGLTFSDENYLTKKTLYSNRIFKITKTDPKSWLIGFDCAHSGDRKDPSLMDEKLRERYSNMGMFSHGHMWTKEEVEHECKTLIDQIIEKYD